MSRCDVAQEILLHSKQAVSRSFDPMCDSGLVKLADSLFGQFFWSEDSSVSDPEALRAKRSDNLHTKVSRLTFD